MCLICLAMHSLIFCLVKPTYCNSDYEVYDIFRMGREIYGIIIYRYIKLAGCNNTGKSMSLNPMFSTEGTSITFSMVGRG